MIFQKRKLVALGLLAPILGFASLSPCAFAQTGTSGQSTTSGQSGSTGQATTSGQATEGQATQDRDEKEDANKHVTDAVAVLKRMQAEPGMSKLLSQARGVFIVPTYGRAALGVGAAGGAGVLLTKGSGKMWRGPAFYDIGGLSVGLQAGAEGGPMALILNNDKAVQSFGQKNNFSVSADAGLTVVDWSKTAQGTAGTGDVTAWTGTKGLFGNVASIAINDIRYDADETNAYYGQSNLMAQDIIGGKVKSPPQAKALQKAITTAAAPATKTK
jgi:lipid-binding SYLF domain-containing protein